ncbi:uncharacterized protein LOC128964478 [Oppia nitens]|uniref:uncharacterized protein LOC128964478 n=1 Tax=Oppia nitens TaxID=1686743 RepID=UPI0023DBD93A|nr:uncharacterized protein LOC128964478 [Oppia nitens]
MPVLRYMGLSHRSRSTFNSSTSSYVNNQKTSCALIIIFGLIIIDILLYVAPGSMQPRATYFAYMFTIILVIMIMKFVFCRNCTKKYENDEQPIELGGGAGGQTPQSQSRQSSVYNIDIPISMDPYGRRHTLTADRLSVRCPSQMSLPPKYETLLPPSYSQAVSLMTLNK